MSARSDAEVLLLAARALEVLRRPKTRVDVAAALALSPSGASRLLRALREAGWVDLAPGYDDVGGRGRTAKYRAVRRVIWRCPS
jgi:hypothetical protein